MDTRAADLKALVERGRKLRDAGCWPEATACYFAANEIDSSRYDIKHNLALSLFAANRTQEASRYLAHAIALKPDLWPSHILKARVLKEGGQIEAADDVLMHVLKHDPRNGHALLAAADLDMNEFGNAVGARERVAPLLNHPVFKAEAELTTLMSKLYDRNETDLELSHQLIDFARRELVMPDFTFDAKALHGTTNKSGRRRVGLISPMFCLSPVYFLTFMAFSQIHRTVDLVVLNRSSKSDIGTDEFRRIAVEWYDVQNLQAPELANAIRRKNLDVLFDLGGWSDPIALKALSTKPARYIYKWVGGQSATTGLAVYDGFITDHVQSPRGSEILHSEPLVRLPGGYISYLVPSYFPRGAPAKAIPSTTVAVAGNPAKISQRLLEQLSESRAEIAFIDRRYASSKAVRRIERVLSGKTSFVSPKSHADYLHAVNKYEHFIDTLPYSSGLTAVELITMGKKIISHPGKLLSSRHCASHLRYAARGTVQSAQQFINWGRKTWLN